MEHGLEIGVEGSGRRHVLELYSGSDGESLRTLFLRLSGFESP